MLTQKRRSGESGVCSRCSSRSNICICCRNQAWQQQKSSTAATFNNGSTFLGAGVDKCCLKTSQKL